MPWGTQWRLRRLPAPSSSRTPYARWGPSIPTAVGPGQRGSSWHRPTDGDSSFHTALQPHHGPADYSSLAALPSAVDQSVMVGVAYERSEDSAPSIVFEAITFAKIHLNSGDTPAALDRTETIRSKPQRSGTRGECEGVTASCSPTTCCRRAVFGRRYRWGNTRGNAKHPGLGHAHPTLTCCRFVNCNGELQAT